MNMDIGQNVKRGHMSGYMTVNPFTTARQAAIIEHHDNRSMVGANELVLAMVKHKVAATLMLNNNKNNKKKIHNITSLLMLLAMC